MITNYITLHVGHLIIYNHLTSHYMTSHHFTLHSITFYNITSHSITSHHIMSQHATFHHIPHSITFHHKRGTFFIKRGTFILVAGSRPKKIFFWWIHIAQRKLYMDPLLKSVHDQYDFIVIKGVHLIKRGTVLGALVVKLPRNLRLSFLHIGQVLL